jgi:hypothetical protein
MEFPHPGCAQVAGEFQSPLVVETQVSAEASAVTAREARRTANGRRRRARVGMSPPSRFERLLSSGCSP